MTVPFDLPLFTVAAVQSARASHARREEQEADDQRYATLRREQAQFRSLNDEPLLVDEPMIEQNCPITPPPELLHQWATEYWGNPGESIGEGEKYIATQAARWGADQELEACCDYISGEGKWFANPGFRLAELRDARRPKPPSLKEQALAKLEAMERLWEASGNTPSDTIRRALEALDD